MQHEQLTAAIPLPTKTIPVTDGISGPVIGYADSFSQEGNRVIATLNIKTKSTTTDRGIQCTARQTIVIASPWSK